MAQDSANPVQNSTTANITQLATILPTIDQPITPASFIPMSEETDDSDDSSSSSNDDDDDDSGDDDFIFRKSILTFLFDLSVILSGFSNAT